MKTTLIVLTLFFSVSCKQHTENLDNSKLAIAATKSTNTLDNLIGSWKIQEIRYQYKDTTYIRNNNDFGRFIFSQENYALMYHPTMMQRQAFKNLSKPEDEEILSAFRSIVFNTGTYTITDSILEITTDMAKVPGFEGGKQYYKIANLDAATTLTMYDETYPDGSKPEWFGEVTALFVLKKED